MTSSFASIIVGTFALGLSGCQVSKDETRSSLAGVRLAVATSNVKKPDKGDPVPLRISGLWINRTNYNVWKDTPQRGAAETGGDGPRAYIAECGLGTVPRFDFVGTNWQANEHAKTARKQISKAFKEWSEVGEQSGLPFLKNSDIGPEFKQMGWWGRFANEPAEIEILWTDLGQDLAGNVERVNIGQNGEVSKLYLMFNSSTRWWFGRAADTPPGHMHFYSTALHEVGHVVGLWESLDPNCVMIHHRNAGPDGPAFDKLDELSKVTAIALYSSDSDPIEYSYR